MVQEATIADLRKNEMKLISVAEPDLMANDPTRKLMRQLMGAVAEYDKDQIVIKLRGARMRKTGWQKGRCEGRKPFGRDDAERATIERMKALRAEGLAFDRIAERLNSEGLPTRTGKRWHGVVVNRILNSSSRHERSRRGRSRWKEFPVTIAKLDDQIQMRDVDVIFSFLPRFRDLDPTQACIRWPGFASRTTSLFLIESKITRLLWSS